jgi:hypothetical protein
MDLLGLYWPKTKSEINIFQTGPYIAYSQSKKFFNFYITFVFQYYFLNIKTLNFYENLKSFVLFWKIWNLKKILKSYENIDFLGNFGNFEFFSKFWEILNIFFF